MNNQIFAEMLIHIPLCSHPNPTRILVIGETTATAQSEFAKHQNLKVDFSSTLEKSLGSTHSTYDVIIVPNDKIDRFTNANLNNMLNNNGIVITQSSHYQDSLEQLQQDLLILGKYFWICIPFNVENKCFIFSSKKYHPLADIILDKADFLDNLLYYSHEIHLASFVMPSSIHKHLTGFAKR